MQQSIEAQNLQQLNYGSSSAKTITLSFWAKSNMTGNFPVTIKKDDNTIHYIVHSFNISSADTWQKFTFTTTPTQGSTNLITQSAAKINNDNGRGMQIFWGLYWGSNYTGSYGGTPTWTTTSNDFADSDVTYNNFFSSTSNNLSITGVQLEIGTAASDFEFLPVDVNIKRCERYFYKSYEIGTAVPTATNASSLGRFLDDNGDYASIQLPMNRMRATPTTVLYNPVTNATASIRSDASNHAATTFGIGSNGGGWAYANGNTINAHTGSRVHFTFDAEL
jgi:hypothetical protein